jgi:hypothetical protein
MTLQRAAKEHASSGHIAVAAQIRFDRSSSFIDGPVQVHPSAIDLDIRFIRSPRSAYHQFKPHPTVRKLLCVSNYPT